MSFSTYISFFFSTGRLNGPYFFNSIFHTKIFFLNFYCKFCRNLLRMFLLCKCCRKLPRKFFLGKTKEILILKNGPFGSLFCYYITMLEYHTWQKITWIHAINPFYNYFVTPRITCNIYLFMSWRIISTKSAKLFHKQKFVFLLVAIKCFEVLHFYLLFYFYLKLSYFKR